MMPTYLLTSCNFSESYVGVILFSSSRDIHRRKLHSPKKIVLVELKIHEEFGFGGGGRRAYHCFIQKKIIRMDLRVFSLPALSPLSLEKIRHHTPSD